MLGIPADELMAVPTALGTFAVKAGDDMGVYLQQPGGYEPDVLAVIRALPADTTAAVVGANVGYFARALTAQLAEPPWCVEPLTENVLLLMENVPEAASRVIRAAASDFNGQGYLACHPSNGGDNRLQVDGDRPVEVRRMDDLIGAVGFALVDAQGHDARVMAGWERTLPQVAVVEHAPELIRFAGGRSPARDLDLYQRLGYDVWSLGAWPDQTVDVNLLLVRPGAARWAAALPHRLPMTEFHFPGDGSRTTGKVGA